MRATVHEITTEELCSYGCGKTARYINKSKNLMCDTSSSKCPAIREINRQKQKILNDERELKTGSRARYDYNKLPDATKDRMATTRGKILVEPSFTLATNKNVNKSSHKKVLILERGHRCEMCNLDVWNNMPISLELDHIDGDNRNNCKENLRLLCRNCHASTDTWKGRNIVKKRDQYITDEEFVKALHTCPNIRQTLLKLGLTAKAANYERAYRLQYEFNINMKS